MFKLILASTLFLSVRAAMYYQSAAQQPSGGSGGYQQDFYGFGGSHGFGGGQDLAGQQQGASSSYGASAVVGPTYYRESGGQGGLSSYGGGDRNPYDSGIGQGQDHHGGVSIVGLGGNQKGITFDLTKDDSGANNGPFGGSILSQHQVSGGRPQYYQDGGAAQSYQEGGGAVSQSYQSQSGYHSQGQPFDRY